MTDDIDVHNFEWSLHSLAGRTRPQSVKIHTSVGVFSYSFHALDRGFLADSPTGVVFAGFHEDSAKFVLIWDRDGGQTRKPIYALYRNLA